MRSVAWLLLLGALGCSSEPVSTPVVVDAGEDTTEPEDAPIVVPPLDPAKCPPAVADLDTGFARATLPSHGVLADKVFPLLADVGDRKVHDVAAVAALATDRDARLRAATACADAPCVVSKVGFTADEASATAAAIVDALGAEAPTVATAIRKAGVAARFATKPDAEFLRAAYADALVAATAALGGYATPAVAKTAADALPVGKARVHEPLVEVLTRGLAAAKRDEATRYEPLVTGENQKALAALATIDWKAFPFAAILVPGLGPVTLDTPLSEGGRLRCDYARARFDKKLAPLIVLSGGHVHPDRTPYSEAIEMKKYLRAQGVPESAILVDPHARHTTTNLRNVGRILLRAGVPADRPLLVTTDLGQTLYMSGTGFTKRCQDELGYVPWRAFGGLSSFDTCFVPSTLVMYADARDPLDP